MKNAKKQLSFDGATDEVNKPNESASSNTLWNVLNAEETEAESITINKKYSKRFANELKDEFKL